MNRLLCFVAALLSLIAAAAQAAEPVRIPAGDVVLGGRYHRPEGVRAAAPAVVLVAGSQASRNLPGLAEALSAAGVAVLDLDKRGVGDSGGFWATETIEQRADDTLAALRFLATRPEVDPRRTGVVGHSQGGWVAQLAAARSADVDFVVMLAGPAQTVREQIMTDERSHLIGWGVPANEAEGRVRMLDALMQAALGNPAVCAGDQPHYLCGLIGYDPAPALAAIRVPVLALYAEKDPMAPPAANVERLSAAIRAGGAPAPEIIVIPGANHLFQIARTGLLDEHASLPPGFAPGVVETVTAWVRSRRP